MTKVILHAWEENAQVYNCLDALLASHEDSGAEDDMLWELRAAFEEAHDKPGERIYLRDGIQSITVFTKLEGEG